MSVHGDYGLVAVWEPAELPPEPPDIRQCKHGYFYEVTGWARAWCSCGREPWNITPGQVVVTMRIAGETLAPIPSLSQWDLLR